MSTHQPVLGELGGFKNNPTSSLLPSKTAKKSSVSVLGVIGPQDLDNLGELRWLYKADREL